MPKPKKLKGKHVIDFDILDVVVIGNIEYESLKYYRDEYWKIIKVLRNLVPSTPTYNPTEMLGDLRKGRRHGRV